MRKNEPAVIGEGSYGCVHRPSLECNKGKIDYKNKVSKVLEKIDAKQELKEHSVIKKLDPDENFYLGEPYSCDIKDTEKNKKSIKKCKSNKYILHGLKDLSLLVIKDGGQNLEEFANSMSEKKATKQNKDIMEKFWIEGLRLLYGIKLLIDNNTIHHDLKPQNVVYNVTTNSMKLIDFGFMTNKNQILSLSKKSKNFFSDFHWSFPPELYFYNKNNYMSFCKKTEAEKTEYFNTLIEEIKEKKHSKFSSAMRTFFYFVIDQSIKENMYSNKIDYFIENLNELLIQNINDKREYSHFLKDSIVTIDIYGIGIAYLYILNKTKHLVCTTVHNKFEELFMSMVCPNYLERPNINTILIHYKNILKDNDYFIKHGSEYDKIINTDSMSKELALSGSIRLSKKDTSISRKSIKREFDKNIYGCASGTSYSAKNKKCILHHKHNVTKKNRKGKEKKGKR